MDWEKDKCNCPGGPHVNNLGRWHLPGCSATVAQKEIEQARQEGFWKGEMEGRFKGVKFGQEEEQARIEKIIEEVRPNEEYRPFWSEKQAAQDAILDDLKSRLNAH